MKSPEKLNIQPKLEENAQNEANEEINILEEE